VRATKVIAAMAVVFLVGLALIFFMNINIEETLRGVRQQAERDQKAAVEAAVKAEGERQARAAVEANEKRKAAEAEVKRSLEAITTEQERFSEAMKQGEKALNADDFERAIANFTAAISVNPSPTKSADAFYYRGLAYLKKDDFDRAIADNTEAIRLSPDNPSAFNNRGLAYHNKGDYDQAIADFNEAIRLNPRYANAFCNRGTTKWKIKDATADEDIAKAKQLEGVIACWKL
jgi:tetratricopeptide (TPR) repeat protein